MRKSRSMPNAKNRPSPAICLRLRATHQSSALLTFYRIAIGAILWERHLLQSNAGGLSHGSFDPQVRFVGASQEDGGGHDLGYRQRHRKAQGRGQAHGIAGGAYDQ